jgi:hypothetical protein
VTGGETISSCIATLGFRGEALPSIGASAARHRQPYPDRRGAQSASMLTVVGPSPVGFSPANRVRAWRSAIFLRDARVSA